jgi:hypothetical protein
MEVAAFNPAETQGCRLRFDDSASTKDLRHHSINRGQSLRSRYDVNILLAGSRRADLYKFEIASDAGFTSDLDLVWTRIHMIARLRHTAPWYGAYLAKTAATRPPSASHRYAVYGWRPNFDCSEYVDVVT